MNHTPPCDPAFLHLIMYPFDHCPRTPLGVLLMATPFLGPLLSKSLSDLIMIYQQDALFKAVFSQVKTTVITPFISPYHRCHYTTVIITVIKSFVSPLSYHLDLITTVLQSLPYHHTVISLLSSHPLVTSSQYILSIHPLNTPLELPPFHGPTRSDHHYVVPIVLRPVLSFDWDRQGHHLSNHSAGTHRLTLTVSP